MTKGGVKSFPEIDTDTGPEVIPDPRYLVFPYQDRSQAYLATPKGINALRSGASKHKCIGRDAVQPNR